MAYFEDDKPLKRVELSKPGYWVDVKTDLKYGEEKYLGAAVKDGSVDVVISADVFLKAVIKAWNLDDKDGNILPITQENIDKLEGEDAALILNDPDIKVDTKEVKKNSPSK